MNVVIAVQLFPLLKNGYQDFTIFYGAGQLLRNGDAKLLYDLPAQDQLQRQFAPHVEIRKAPLPYMHPPFEALLFVPLARLNFLSAYLFWTLLNFLMLALTLAIVIRTFPEVAALSRTFVILAALGFAPVAAALLQGQDSILLLLLVTASLASIERHSDRAAGAMLGAGLFRFHLVLPLVIILAVRRPRLLLGFLPVAAGAVLLSAALVGWQGLSVYAHLLLRLESGGAGGAISPIGMPNLRGLIADLLGTHGGGAFRMWLTAVCSILIMAFAIWEVCRRPAPIHVVFALAVVTAIMLSYHSFPHDLTLLLPSILLLLAAQPEASSLQKSGRTILLLIMFVYILFLGFPVWPKLDPLWFVPMLFGIYRGNLQQTDRKVLHTS